MSDSVVMLKASSLSKYFGASGIPWGAIIPYLLIIIPWTMAACRKLFHGVE